MGFVWTCCQHVEIGAADVKVPLGDSAESGGDGAEVGNRELVCRREGPRTEIVPIGYILHVDIDPLNTSIEIGTSQQLRQKLIDKGQGCKGSGSRSSIISRFCKGNIGESRTIIRILWIAALEGSVDIRVLSKIGIAVD